MTSQESMFSSDATTTLSQHKWVVANREANARKVKETKVNKTVTGCRVAIEGPCATNLYCTLATHPFQALNARMEQKAKEDKVKQILAQSQTSPAIPHHQYPISFTLVCALQIAEEHRWLTEERRGRIRARQVRCLGYRVDNMSIANSFADVHSGYILNRNTMLGTRLAPLPTRTPSLNSRTRNPPTRHAHTRKSLRRKSRRSSWRRRDRDASTSEGASKKRSGCASE